MATSHHRQCSICLEDFKQPKFLDCFHTFCLECLRALENKTPGFNNCPLCQKEIQLPSGGVDKLTTNFYIQDTPLVGVEGGENVSRGLSSTNLGDASIQTNLECLRARLELLQAGARSQQQSGSQTKFDKTEQDEHKLIQMEYMYTHYTIPSNRTQSFGGIVLNLGLYYYGQTATLRLSIELSETNEFIHSCNIDCDITFINQKDSEFSVSAAGKDYVQSSQGYPYYCKTMEIDLIRRRDALNDKNGFIVKTSEDGCKFTFELSVGITVSNIKKVNFSLK